MKVMICGVDGYLGWPLALRMKSDGHEVMGIDNMSRRYLVREVGSETVIPIRDFRDRSMAVKDMHCMDVLVFTQLKRLCANFLPDVIVYLSHNPSAPYSMRGSREAHLVQRNNTLGHLNMLWAIREACPNTHLLTLGTMGEYGTPEVVIPEAGPESFPRQPGSLYHASKVHNSVNAEFACRAWGMRCTDVMQGVVYGTRTPQITSSENYTRFDVDDCFGTVINRFCAQAVIEMPLTIYGAGGQQRCFLPLRDSIECLSILANNPPHEGQYRVVNQFDKVYKINALAHAVREAGESLGLSVSTKHIENPRVEKENHHYSVVGEKLPSLGYKPSGVLSEELEQIIGDLLPHKDRIERVKEVIMPTTKWR